MGHYLKRAEEIIDSYESKVIQNINVALELFNYTLCLDFQEWTEGLPCKIRAIPS